MPGVPFKKGADARRGTGKPRQKGLAWLVRYRMKDGKHLVDFMADVMEGRQMAEDVVFTPDGERRVVQVPPSLKDRMEAAKWLALRGWGTPFASDSPEGQEVEESLSAVSDETLLSHLKPVPSS